MDDSLYLYYEVDISNQTTVDARRLVLGSLIHPMGLGIDILVITVA
jgi:hypothetical protein